MTCLAFVGKVLSFSLKKIRNASRSGVNDFSAPFAAAKRPLNIGRNALSFRSDSLQFLPAAVKLRNFFSGSSQRHPLRKLGWTRRPGSGNSGHGSRKRRYHRRRRGPPPATEAYPNRGRLLAHP